MSMHNRIFEIDPWKIKTKNWPQKNALLLESLTSIGNGYMGMRGNFEEGYSGESHQGTYLAGVWFPDKTRVGWWKNGYPQYFGKIINTINFAMIKIKINGHSVDLAQTSFDDFYLELDMQNGLVTRSYTVAVADATVHLQFRRFFSIVERRLAHFELTMEAIIGEPKIEIFSGLDGNVCNKDSNYNQYFWTVIDQDADAPAFLQMQTVQNQFGTPRFIVSAAMQNRLSVSTISKGVNHPDLVGECFTFSLGMGENAVFEKNVAVVTDRDTGTVKQRYVAACLLACAEKSDFNEHLHAQAVAWEDRWLKSDVEICGDVASQQGIRFNIFQLFSTYYGEDERLNIGPKGFTGEKYGGATYWDTEAYILPMYLSIVDPTVNEKLLKYRHNQLNEAMHNAHQQGLDGALYPMVTFTGVECHNEWEITFEEIHRNGAIAYAIYNYTNYTGDEKYLFEEGIDVLVEISRFWASRVHLSKNKNVYMLHGVTGPNEYENNVNNNWYTNYLCQWTLQYTLACLDKISPTKAAFLKVSDEEQQQWQAIQKKMYLPEDRKRDIFVQNDCFLDKDLCSTEMLTPEDRPLNQHWSWDKILRSCYIKQADVLQGIYLFGNHFTMEQKKHNFEFYEPMTVHESSLSACVHAILAAELGKVEKAMELYKRSARLDLDNYNNDTEDGLHITSMSGSWLAIVQGFAGMRTADETLSFSPVCPHEWSGYAFMILYRHRRLRVEVEQNQINITLLSGSSLKMKIFKKLYTLSDKTLQVTFENYEEQLG